MPDVPRTPRDPDIYPEGEPPGTVPFTDIYPDDPVAEIERLAPQQRPHTPRCASIDSR